MTSNSKQLTIRKLYWLSFALGLAWTVYLCVNSPGASLDDEIGHLLISKNAWKYPELVLNLWGRPVDTLLYMIPSIWGLNAARFFSIVMACLTILVTTKTAQKSNVTMLFLIPTFLWFQPWFNKFSYEAITEVPFTFLLVLGTYLWLDKREVLASIPMSLLPLVRHEGIALTLLWLVWVICQRNWKAVVVSVSPFVLFNVIYCIVFQSVAIEMYFSPKPTTIYGNGTWFHFVRPVLRNVGIPVALLASVGVVPLLKLKEKLFMFGYIAYYLIHTALYRFGLYASGGYTVFLLPLAPAVAIVAALGTEFVTSWVQKALARFVRLTGSRVLYCLLIVLIVIAVVSTGLQTKPRPLGTEVAALKQASDWLRSSDLVDNKIVATHVWFFYFYDLALDPVATWTDPPSLEYLPAGTIVVWDQKYSNLWGLSYDELAGPRNNWKRLNSFGDNAVVIFQKTRT